jgi:hypothetical protein
MAGIKPKASSQKWKDSNSNYGVKVSSATVAKLKQGTKASNIAAANKPGASAELKEAVRRFYGKGAVANTPKGATPSSPNVKENRPPRKPSPNDREGRKPAVGSPKPMPGPGGRKPKAPAGGPGSKPRPSSGQTPNQREGRKTVNSPKPSGGPGAKNTRPGIAKGGPGSKPRPSKGQTPNQREGRKTVNSPKPSGGPGAKPRTKKYYMRAGG